MTRFMWNLWCSAWPARPLSWVRQVRVPQDAARRPAPAAAIRWTASDTERLRQRGDLRVGPFALHGQETPIRRAQMPRIANEVGQRGQRARDHRVERRGRPVDLGARVHDLDVAEPRSSRGCARRNAPSFRWPRSSVKRRCGIHDGERQPGKSRARAHIGDARSAQVGLHAQTVEHVLEQHAGPIANRRQIEFRIGRSSSSTRASSDSAWAGSSSTSKLRAPSLNDASSSCRFTGHRRRSERCRRGQRKRRAPRKPPMWSAGRRSAFGHPDLRSGRP